MIHVLLKKDIPIIHSALLSHMKKLNRPIEEIRAMNNIRRKRYYENHKEVEKKKNLARYHRNKKKVSNADMPFSGSSGLNDGSGSSVQAA
jgi:ribosomal protein S21